MSITSTRRAILFAVLISVAAACAWSDSDQEEATVQERWDAFMDSARESWEAWATGTDAWIIIGPASAFVNLQDTRMAPLIYSGFGAGLVACDTVIRENWAMPTTLTFHFALPAAGTDPPGLYRDIAADLDSAFLWRIAERAPDGAEQPPATDLGVASGFAIGGGIRAGTNVRIYDKLSNSALNADIVTSLNLAAQYSSQIPVARRMAAWYLRGTLPLVSWVGRTPEYSLYGTASYWAPPWQFFRLTIETGFTWNLRWSEENIARLAYIWDFYALDELEGLHVLRIGSHSVSLSLGTRRL